MKLRSDIVAIINRYLSRCLRRLFRYDDLYMGIKSWDWLNNKNWPRSLNSDIIFTIVRYPPLIGLSSILRLSASSFFLSPSRFHGHYSKLETSYRLFPFDNINYEHLSDRIYASSFLPHDKFMLRKTIVQSTHTRLHFFLFPPFFSFSFSSVAIFSVDNHCNGLNGVGSVHSRLKQKNCKRKISRV